jgi:uncharacterized protein (TIGR00730 family)
VKRICVYCGSNPGASPAYAAAARALGGEIARRGLGLVYGGASVGLMGAVANAALAGGAEVIGVIPHFFAVKEVAHRGLDELLVVDSMHERKARMAELADGFVALPGGWGTLEEIFEVLTWAQLGLHEKPCGLLDVGGYFDDLYRFLERAVAEAFVREEFRPMIVLENDAGRLLDRFAAYRAPRVRKWIRPEET